MRARGPRTPSSRLRAVTPEPDVAAAVARLDELTRRLRRECPWDREQDERSIVPHTVEEAYELADAANDGDDAELLDELGDVLFQVHFLSLLLEERGFGDVPENLPALLHARKVQRRAATSGFDFDRVPYDAISGELEELEAAGTDRDAAFHEVGDVLFAAVNVARKLHVDPELALRSASARFRGRVEEAERLAAEAGAEWEALA